MKVYSQEVMNDPGNRGMENGEMPRQRQRGPLGHKVSARKSERKMSQREAGRATLSCDEPQSIITMLKQSVCSSQRGHTSKELGGRFHPKLAYFGGRLEGLAGDFLSSLFSTGEKLKNGTNGRVFWREI
jgi:hypothetical protein